MEKLKTAAPEGRRPKSAIAIADAREKLGWSQEKLAEKIGRAQQTVAGWERERNVPSDAWLPLCATLNLSLVTFLGDGSEGVVDQYIEDAIAARQQRLFRRLYSDLRAAASEFGEFYQEDDFAFLAHTLWTRALLLDEATPLAERVDIIVNRQRRAWQRKAGKED